VNTFDLNQDSDKFVRITGGGEVRGKTSAQIKKSTNEGIRQGRRSGKHRWLNLRRSFNWMLGLNVFNDFN